MISISHFHKRYICNTLIIFAVVLVSIRRIPEILYQPRFYAEEGANFFSYAYSHSLLENLLHPQFGYYSLYNFLITSLATNFTLEVAPLVTTYSAFIMLIIASCTALLIDIPGLDTNLKRFVVAIYIPLIPYFTIWLNTLGVQYILCVIVYFILLENTSTYINKQSLIIKCFILVIAGLSGVTSCFLTPSFIYKTIKTKSKTYALYSSILIICTLVQLGVFLYAKFINNADLSGRFVRHDFITQLDILDKNIIFFFYDPFFGAFSRHFNVFQLLDSMIHSNFPLTTNIKMALTPAIIGIAIIMLIAMIVYKTKNRLNTQLFMISFTLVTVLSIIFSINMSGGPRYSFAPSVMLITLITTSYQEQKIINLQRSAIITLLMSMVIMNFIGSPFCKNGFDIDDCPRWTDEVRIWRQYNAYSLKIWPTPWEMQLQ